MQTSRPGDGGAHTPPPAPDDCRCCLTRPGTMLAQCAETAGSPACSCLRRRLSGCKACKHPKVCQRKCPMLCSGPPMHHRRLYEGRQGLGHKQTAATAVRGDIMAVVNVVSGMSSSVML